MSEKFAEHQSTKYHQACIELADDLKWRIEHTQQVLPALLDRKRAENIEKKKPSNREVIGESHSLLWKTVFCSAGRFRAAGHSRQPWKFS